MDKVKGRSRLVSIIIGQVSSLLDSVRFLVIDPIVMLIVKMVDLAAVIGGYIIARMNPSSITTRANLASGLLLYCLMVLLAVMLGLVFPSVLPAMMMVKTAPLLFMWGGYLLMLAPKSAVVPKSIASLVDDVLGRMEDKAQGRETLCMPNLVLKLSLFNLSKSARFSALTMLVRETIMSYELLHQYDQLGKVLPQISKFRSSISGQLMFAPVQVVDLRTNESKVIDLAEIIASHVLGEASRYVLGDQNSKVLQDLRASLKKVRGLHLCDGALLGAKGYEGVVEIPNGVTEIAAYAFEGRADLRSVKIPDSVKEIGDFAFIRNSSLGSISLPDSVTEIGDFAFHACHALASARISNRIKYISASAFEGCRNLSSVVIPKSVKYIGKQAFQGCSALSSINIPSGVERIEEFAFAGCSGLLSVNIPGSVKYLSDDAFAFVDSETLKSASIAIDASWGCFPSGCRIKQPSALFNPQRAFKRDGIATQAEKRFYEYIISFISQYTCRILPLELWMIIIENCRYTCLEARELVASLPEETRDALTRSDEELLQLAKHRRHIKTWERLDMTLYGPKGGYSRVLSLK